MWKVLLKQIWNERKSNAWLWAELLIVFVALWYVVDWSYVYIYTYFQPRGFSIENTWQLRFNVLVPQSPKYIPAEQRTAAVGDDFLAMIERLRHHPDVEYVSVSQNSSPYNGSNSSDGLRQDSTFISRLRRWCTPDFFQVFQYQNADGSGSRSLAEAFGKNTIVVPSNFWEERYPGGKNLLNQGFYRNDDTTTAYRVAAVTRVVRYADFRPPRNSTYYAIPMEGADLAALPGADFSYYEVCIRTRPGASADFPGKLLKDAPRLYNVGNCYIQSIQPFSEIRHAFQLDDVNALKNRAFIMFFLLVNIFLGIVGTFWYRTQQRRPELGLRVALGSSRSSLNQLLAGEGLLLLLLASVPAFVVCYNIGNAGISDAWQLEWGMARFLPAVLIAFLLLLLMIMAGIWYPAHQAVKLQPAEALRDE